MEVRIQAIHFDATEKLQDFIQKKTAKLEKYCDDINKVEVSLKVVKPETAMNKEASIKVLVPNGGPTTPLRTWDRSTGAANSSTTRLWRWKRKKV